MFYLSNMRNNQLAIYSYQKSSLFKSIWLSNMDTLIIYYTHSNH